MSEDSRTSQASRRRFALWAAAFVGLVIVLPALSFLIRGTPAIEAPTRETTATAEPFLLGTPYRAETWVFLSDIDRGGEEAAPAASNLEVVTPAGDGRVWVVDHPLSDPPVVRARLLEADGALASEFEIPAPATLFTPGAEGDLWVDVPSGAAAQGEVVRRYGSDGALLGEYPLPPGLFARSLTLSPEGDLYVLSEEWLFDIEQEDTFYSGTLLPVVVDGEAVPPDQLRQGAVEGMFFGLDGALYRGTASGKYGGWPEMQVEALTPGAHAATEFTVPAGFRPFAADADGRLYAAPVAPGEDVAGGRQSLGDPGFDTSDVLVIGPSGIEARIRIARPLYVASWPPPVEVTADGTLLHAVWAEGGIVRVSRLTRDEQAVGAPLDAPEPAAPDMVIHAPKMPLLGDPYAARDVVERDVMRLLYAGLVGLDDSLEPFPSLAIEVPTPDNGGVSADGLTIRYTLREGVTWHDGEPVTAADVAATWEYLREPSLVPRAEPFVGFDAIEEVRADGLDVTVVLDRPIGVGPLSFFPYVLPGHLLDTQANLVSAPMWERPVGCGPFAMEGWDERGWSLVAHGGAPQGPAKLNRVRVEFDASAADPVTSGLPEVWLWPDEPTAGKLAGMGLQRGYVETGRFWGVVFDSTGGALADPAVRGALVSAYPSKQLGEGYFDERFGSDPYAAQPPDGTAASVADEASPDEARALLDSAGWVDADGDGMREKSGVPLEVTVQVTTRGGRDELPSEAVTEIEEAWTGIGVDARHEFNRTRFYASWLAGGYLATEDFSAAAGVFPAGPDAGWGGTLDLRDAPGPGNVHGVAVGGGSDAEIELLFAQAEASYDRETRRRLSVEITALWRERAFGIVDRYERRPLFAAGINGIAPGPYPSGDLWNVSAWAVADE